MNTHQRRTWRTPAFRPVPKPTLRVLRQRANISVQCLAEAAGLSCTEDYVLEIGGSVSRQVAQKGLAAFSQLTGTTCTLNDIAVRVYRDQSASG